MPAGIVSTLTDFTVATWVNLAATTQWSRVFDFGTGPNTNMFLTVNAGTGPRFAITTAGGGNEQRINPTTPGQLPTNQWIHLAVTLSGNTGTLYVNGAPVGTQHRTSRCARRAWATPRRTGSASRSTATPA